MIDTFTTLQALAASLVVLLIFQVRRHYVIALNHHRLSLASKKSKQLAENRINLTDSVSSQDITVSKRLAVNPSKTPPFRLPEPEVSYDVEESPQEEPISDVQTKSIEVEAKIQKPKNDFLGDYIGDFFSAQEPETQEETQPSYTVKPAYSVAAIKESNHADAMNDEHIMVVETS